MLTYCKGFAFGIKQSAAQLWQKGIFVKQELIIITKEAGGFFNFLLVKVHTAFPGALSYTEWVHQNGIKAIVIMYCCYKNS